jgi:hypothetical protein
MDTPGLPASHSTKGSDLGIAVQDIVSILQSFATEHGRTIVVVRANHYIDGPDAVVPQTGVHPDESVSDIDNPHRLHILIPDGATGSLSAKSHKCWIKDGQLFTSRTKLWEMHNVHETDPDAGEPIPTMNSRGSGRFVISQTTAKGPGHRIYGGLFAGMFIEVTGKGRHRVI